MRTAARIRPYLPPVAIAATLLLGLACVAYRWRPQPITELALADSGATGDSARHEVVPGRHVKIQLKSGVVELYVRRLEYPWLHGDTRRHAAGSPEPTVAAELASVRRLWLARSDDAYDPRRGRELDLAEVRRDPSLVAGHGVIMEGKGFRLVLRDARLVSEGWLEGRLLARHSNGPVRIDLRETQGLAVSEVDGPRTALRTIAGVGAVVAVTALVVALTKESCPFVYADTGAGWELHGEAYAGAAFRSTQRDDLLPLGAPGSGSTMRVRLRNEARETQYTDRAELLLVDHPASARALATFDGRPVLVGAATPALRLHDQSGRDVARELAARDEVLLETDAAEIASTPDELVRETATAEFAAPATGTPVLELVAGNTTLLDLTFGRFFAAMGDRLGGYIEKGNAQSAGPGIARWREREGVDLVVDLWREGSWRRVAVVPTVGPAALREIAVPLPGMAGSTEPLRVRVSAGLGFWRIDRMALSTVHDAEPVVHRLAPVRALGSAERDERATLATTDGRYNALSLMNESLVMEFALPPRAADRVRSAFLSSNGYYNVHPPVQAQWLPGTLKVLRDEPGAFARFGRDLARVYVGEALIASSGR